MSADGRISQIMSRFDQIGSVGSVRSDRFGRIGRIGSVRSDRFGRIGSGRIDRNDLHVIEAEFAYEPLWEKRIRQETRTESRKKRNRVRKTKKLEKEQNTQP